MVTVLAHPSLAENRRALRAYVGMVVFLGAWGMTFASLFFSYAVIRVESATWPPDGAAPLPLALPALNTVLLGLSSFTMHRCLSSLRAGRPGLRWLFWTIALGAGFLALQLVVWKALHDRGLRADSGQYGSIFYTLTIFHALHVACGLIALLAIAPRVARGRFASGNTTAVRTCGMFWHFVDAVWVVTFVTVYLL